MALAIAPSAADQAGKPFPPTIAKSYQSPGYVAPPTANPSGKVTILDLFSAMPDSNWGADDANSTLVPHALHFHVPAKQQATRFAVGYKNPEVDVTALVLPAEEAKPGAQVGLVVGADGKGNAAGVFVIDPVARRSAVFSEKDGKLTPVRTWSDAPELQKWIPNFPHGNRIEVVAGAHAATFLINGRQIADIPMPEMPIGSLFGLYAAGSDTDVGDFGFVNVLAHFPSAEPLPPAKNYISGPDSKPADIRAPGTVETGPALALGFAWGETVFTDDFKTLDPTWGKTGDYAFVKDGKFEFHAPAGHSISRTSGKYAFLADVDFAADIVAAPDNKPDCEAGLSFWADGSGDTQTVFEIDPAGRSFSVQSETDDKWTVVTDWRSTPLIKSGTGATNRLEVIITDYQQVLLLINGHQVGQIPISSTLAGGLIGFYAAGSDNDPSDFGFANFVAKMPADSPLPPSTVAAPKTGAGQTIFSDDFKSLDPTWGTTADASPIKDGRLEITGAANDDTVVVNDKYEYGEADISTGMTEEIGGPDDALGGLLFWSADADDYFLFAVNPFAGTFAVYQQDENKSTTLIEWTDTKSLDVGAGKTNRIEVATRKDKAFLILNGHQVGEIPAPKKSPGALIGVYGSGSQKAAATFGFSNLTVVAPAGEDAPAGVTVEVLPTLVATEGSFTDDFQNMDDGGWGKPDTHVYTANGRMEVHTDTGTESDAFEGAHLVETGDVIVSMVAEDGTQSGASGGLLFWANDYKNYTLFAVDPRSSKFAVFQEIDGKSTTLLDWRGTSLLYTEANKSNLIGVQLRPDRAIFLINGHRVGQIMPSGKPAGLALGFDSYADKNGPGNFGFTHLVFTPPATGDLPPSTSAAPTVAAGQTIFSDDFKTLDPSWGIAGTSTNVHDGRLELRSDANDEVDRINNKYAYGDADISTSMTEIDGGKAGPQGGILFWAEDADNYTLFDVDPASGKFAAFEESDGKNVTLKKWTASDAIKQGVGVSNRLEVVLEGNKAHLMVNGQEVGQLDKAGTVPGQMAGLYAGGADGQPGHFDFAGFVVKAPGGAAKEAVATPTPASSQAAVAPAPPSAPAAATAPAASASTYAAAASPFADANSASAAPVATAAPVETKGSQHGTLSSPGSAHGSMAAATAGSPPPQQAPTAPVQASTAPVSASPGSNVPPAPSVIQPPAAAPLAVPASPQQEAAAPSQMCPGDVVFADDFKTMDRAWGRRDPNTFVTPNHAFGLAAMPNHLNGRFNQASRYADIDMCVNAFVSMTNDPSDMGGLLFWGDNTDDFYFLAVTEDGRFAVFQFVNSAIIATPIPLTKTGALKTGKSVPNAIEVSLRGDQGTVIINGQTVGTFTGALPARGGLIGLEMAAQPAGPSAWGFYHLVVSKPVSAAELAVEQSAGVAAAGGDLPSAAPTSALGQASAAAPSASPGCGGQILYQDNFDTLDPSWGAADQSFTVKNGALMVSAAAAMTTARSNTKAHYGDFDVCLLAGSPLSPNAAGSGGLIFWASDARNFYVLAVSSGGSYAILRYTAGEVSAPVPWGPTDALKPGAGVWNALEVKAVGTTATIVINGRTLTTIQGTPPAGGSLIALVAAAPNGNATTWAFGRLRISAPTGAAVPAQATVAGGATTAQPVSTRTAGSDRN
jgi:hypothetical protein